MKRADRLARDSRIVAALKAGQPLALIAEQHLMSTSGVHEIAKRHGLPTRYPNRRPSTSVTSSPTEINRRNREFWSNPATLVAYGWAAATEHLKQRRASDSETGIFRSETMPSDARGDNDASD